ncbi:uncharacterized protein LOC141566823 isoform X3 [Sminthopsis crassicaudata]|uniref:uncharacterized protein LOC141566823 isoform X3 n=1 Tax=Sminthopsis crassicaudata TaxID=9301 RepID=UPI003D6963E1
MAANSGEVAALVPQTRDPDKEGIHQALDLTPGQEILTQTECESKRFQLQPVTDEAECVILQPHLLRQNGHKEVTYR